MQIGNRNTAQRLVNARIKLVETLATFGEISMDDADKVAALYLKHKIAKLDAVMGTCHVKHGAYYNKQTIRDTIESLTR